MKESGRDGTGHKTGPENGRNKYIEERKKKGRRKEEDEEEWMNSTECVCVFSIDMCLCA